MINRRSVFLASSILPGIIFIGCIAMAQSQPIDFNDDKWDLSNAKVTEHLRRNALMGMAFLKAV